jgi:hypothetical protein
MEVGIQGKSFVLKAQEELGGFVELTALQAAALFLDFAEPIEGFLELAGKAGAVQAERGQLRDQRLGVGVLGKQIGFQGWDAIDAPGGVGEFLGEMRFCGGGGFVFVDKLLDVELVGGGVLGREDGDARGQAVGEGVERRTLTNAVCRRRCEDRWLDWLLAVGYWLLARESGLS